MQAAVVVVDLEEGVMEAGVVEAEVAVAVEVEVSVEAEVWQAAVAVAEVEEVAVEEEEVVWRVEAKLSLNPTDTKVFSLPRVKKMLLSLRTWSLVNPCTMRREYPYRWSTSNSIMAL